VIVTNRWRFCDNCVNFSGSARALARYTSLARTDGALAIANFNQRIPARRQNERARPRALPGDELTWPGSTEISTAIRLEPPRETGRRLLSHPKVLRSQPEKYSQRDWPLRLTQ